MYRGIGKIKDNTLTNKSRSIPALVPVQIACETHNNSYAVVLKDHI